MRASKNGIDFTRHELRCLRGFGSKDISNRDLFGVRVVVDGGFVYAQAANGHGSVVQVRGHSDGAHRDIDAFVHMGFLIDGRRALEKKQELRLHFSGASLNQCSVVENDIVRLTLQSQEEQSLLQTSFTYANRVLTTPGAHKGSVHYVAVGLDYCKAILLICEAAESEFFQMFPPRTADDFVVVQPGQGKDAGEIIAWIKPGLSKESAADPDDDEKVEDDKPRRGRKKKGQAELPGTDAAAAE